MRLKWIFALGIVFIITLYLLISGYPYFISLSWDYLKGLGYKGSISTIQVLPDENGYGDFQGFAVIKWATGLKEPFSMAQGKDGAFYISLPKEGKILKIEDASKSGLGEKTNVFASDLKEPSALAFYEDKLLVAEPGKLVGITDSDGDGDGDIFEDWVSDLPLGENLGMAIDRAKNVAYLSLVESGVGKVMAIDLKEKKSYQFASGFREPSGLAINGQNGDLLGVDSGFLSSKEKIYSEINLVVERLNYGYPQCFNSDTENKCPDAVLPIWELGAGSYPSGLAFYTGSAFPPEYQNNLFVGFRGLFSAQSRAIWRFKLVPFSGSYAISAYPFAYGFNRIVDITMGVDGNLYILDSGSGEIYQIMAVYK